MSSTPVDVKQSPVAGLGLFATRRIARGEEIASAPVLVFPAEQAEALFETVAGEYCFEWSDGTYALVLGPASLLNHSRTPNVQAVSYLDAATMSICALCDIEPGQELLIDYTQGDAATTLWFEAPPA